MVLTQQAEVLLDLVMAVIGGGLGWSHAGRIVCRTPGVTLESVHRYAKKAVTGIAVALGTVLVLSLAGIIRSIAWMFPLTFEILIWPRALSAVTSPRTSSISARVTGCR